MAVQDLRFLDEQCLLVIKFSNIDHFFQNVLWEFILHHHLEILTMFFTNFIPADLHIPFVVYRCLWVPQTKRLRFLQSNRIC